MCPPPLFASLRYSVSVEILPEVSNVDGRGLLLDTVTISDREVEEWAMVRVNRLEVNYQQTRTNSINHCPSMTYVMTFTVNPLNPKVSAV